jgi:hypothetical protein
LQPLRGRAAFSQDPARECLEISQRPSQGHSA